MKVPKTTLQLIKEIESVGGKLKTLEAELYDWLETKGLNPEDDEPNENGLYLDMCLEFLFHHHDGSDLVNYLQKHKGGKK